MSPNLVAALLVGSGLALLVVGIFSRGRDRVAELAAVLDLPYGEEDVAVETITESGLFGDTLGAASRIVDQFDAQGNLRLKLEKARIPMRPGEFVLVAFGGSLVAGLVIATLTTRAALGIVTVLAGPFAANIFLNVRINKRRKKLESQLPEALGLVASSLSAGHTFLRSIQLMTDEAEPPLSEEFGRVVQETRLGDPVVDALERMARRLEVDDLVWVVQAIRIQQEVGGKLADLLHTLTDYMRAREEIRREVDVLTAEGRMSAWVLGALPVFLMLAVHTISPGYLDPLFQGKGWWVLGFTAASIVAGVVMIRRMSEIDI